PAFADAARQAEQTTQRLVSARGKRTVDDFHRQLGKLMWDHCGMARTAQGLTQLLEEIPRLHEEFWRDVMVPGTDQGFNQEAEKANRVGDFLELAELMAADALHREESCGGHFREEYQTEEGEAQRNDARFSYVAAWEWRGAGEPELLHTEPLAFEYVKP